MIRRNRWGNKSQKIEKTLMERSVIHRNARTGKRVRFIRSFQAVADKYGVSRELVRQIATDLGIRSMYTLRGSARLGAWTRGAGNGATRKT